MKSSSCCCICFPAFGHAAVNHTTTLFVNHGDSGKIRCDYSRTNDTEIMTVDLKTLNHKHMCSYIHLTSWQKQSCKDHIRFIWISEVEEISFELLNLRIKDTTHTHVLWGGLQNHLKWIWEFREFKLLVNHFLIIRKKCNM